MYGGGIIAIKSVTIKQLFFATNAPKTITISIQSISLAADPLYAAYIQTQFVPAKKPI